MTYALLALIVRVLASALVVWRAYTSWAQVPWFATAPQWVGACEEDGTIMWRQKPRPMPRWLLVSCALTILAGIWL